MTVSGALARPLLAGIFIYGGVESLRDPESRAKAADDVAPMIARALRLPTTDTVTLVRINAGVQVAAGTLLALGKGRRLSAVVLAASLIPTTYAGHRFWEEVDEERRARQRIQFLKNLAILGGLVLAAGDTGGRPSLPWQARRAATHAVEAAVAAGAATEDVARQVLDTTKNARQVAASELSRRARKAALKARKAKLAELAMQARQAPQAAKESEIGKGAVKAAKKAANKAKKAKFTRRAMKAARDAAEKAEKAELTKRAQGVTRSARKAAAKSAAKAAKAAAKAAAKTAKKARKANLGPRALGAAAEVQHTAADAVSRAREAAAEVARNVAADGSLGQARDRAVTVAHRVAARAGDALPIAS